MGVILGYWFICKLREDALYYVVTVDLDFDSSAVPVQSSFHSCQGAVYIIQVVEQMLQLVETAFGRGWKRYAILCSMFQFYTQYNPY